MRSKNRKPKFLEAWAASCLVLVMVLPWGARPLAAAEKAVEPRLVDDFEDGDLEAPSGLYWIILTDEQFGGTSKARVEVVAGEDARGKSFLRFSGETTEEAPVVVAAAWVPISKEGLAEDLNAYSGIRFTARSVGEQKSFALGARRGRAQIGLFDRPFEVGAEWTVIEVPFAEMKQTQPALAPMEWSKEDVSWLGFVTPRGYLGPFTLEVERLEIY